MHQRLVFRDAPENETALQALRRLADFFSALGQRIEGTPMAAQALDDAQKRLSSFLGIEVTLPRPYREIVVGFGVPTFERKRLFFAPDELKDGLHGVAITDQFETRTEDEISELERCLTVGQPDEGTASFWLARRDDGALHWFDADAPFALDQPKTFDQVVGAWVREHIENAEHFLANGSTPLPDGSWRHP